MYDGKPLVARGVGVCVDVVGLAVCGPACVTNADSAFEVFTEGVGFEVRDFAFTFVNVEMFFFV